MVRMQMPPRPSPAEKSKKPPNAAAFAPYIRVFGHEVNENGRLTTQPRHA